jgi:hypothetical protein
VSYDILTVLQDQQRRVLRLVVRDIEYFTLSLHSYQLNTHRPSYINAVLIQTHGVPNNNACGKLYQFICRTTPNHGQANAPAIHTVAHLFSVLPLVESGVGFVGTASSKIGVPVALCLMALGQTGIVRHLLVVVVVLLLLLRLQLDLLQFCRMKLRSQRVRRRRRRNWRSLSYDRSQMVVRPKIWCCRHPNLMNYDF